MDIASLSMAMSQEKLLDSVGVAVLDMNLEAINSMGNVLQEAISEMPAASLESLANPALGGNFEITV